MKLNLLKSTFKLIVALGVGVVVFTFSGKTAEAQDIDCTIRCESNWSQDCIVLYSNGGRNVCAFKAPWIATAD